MSRLAALLGVISCVLAFGCQSKPYPTDPFDRGTPAALRTIVRAYEQAVAEIHARPDETWHHNWHGNIWPNTVGGRHRGLCYEWQEEVWKSVGPVVQRVGWEGVGLAANVDRWTEHHVIVVFDPSRIGRDELIPPLPPGVDPSDGLPQGEGWGRRPPNAMTRPAWVLDPWHTGEPLVYTLDEWLIRGTADWYSVALEELPAPVPPAGR
jgi:hypothetical protein